MGSLSHTMLIKREREAMESADINLYANKHIVHHKFSLLWNVDHSCYRVTKENC